MEKKEAVSPAFTFQRAPEGLRGPMTELANVTTDRVPWAGVFIIPKTWNKDDVEGADNARGWIDGSLGMKGVERWVTKD